MGKLVLGEMALGKMALGEMELGELSCNHFHRLSKSEINRMAESETDPIWALFTALRTIELGYIVDFHLLQKFQRFL